MLRPPSRLDSGVTRARVTTHRHLDEQVASHDDWVIVEEPLQIRVTGDPIAVTMRTPGHDHELVAGYLLSEGWIRGPEALGSVRHCDTGPDPTNNVIDVLPAPGSAFDGESVAPRRQLSTSACGLCGREQIDDLLTRVQPFLQRSTFGQRQLSEATARLRSFQHNYAKTGGGHAAAVIDRQGAFLCVREDIGRHNAVDKVVGRMLLDDALPLTGRALLVSGRISFEIVQKAAMAGLELVLGISAPSSLAITTAERLHMTLVGFSRPEAYNVYSGDEWLVR